MGVGRFIAIYAPDNKYEYGGRVDESDDDGEELIAG